MIPMTPRTYAIFFRRVAGTRRLAGVHPSKGKFRAFLLACCRHFLSHQRDHDRAKKRGGGHPIVSIDVRDAENRYRNEPVDNLTPEALFDRRWALILLESVLVICGPITSVGKVRTLRGPETQLTGGPETPRSPRLRRASGYRGCRASRGPPPPLPIPGGPPLSDRRHRRRPAEIEEEVRDLFAAVAL